MQPSSPFQQTPSQQIKKKKRESLSEGKEMGDDPPKEEKWRPWKLNTHSIKRGVTLIWKLITHQGKE